MARFCFGCGNPLKEGALFCNKCGRKVEPVAARPPTPPAPVYARPAAPPRPPVPAHARARKGNKGLAIGLSISGAVLVLVLIFGGGVLWVASWTTPAPTPAKSAKPAPTPTVDALGLLSFPDSLKVPASVKVNCKYDSPDTIIPANYRSLPYIVDMLCWTDGGAADVIVRAEIPGFTQKYEQKISVSHAETEITIHPALIDGVAKTLTTSKDSQLVVSVTDTKTNKVIVQDTKPIKVYSRNDIQWQSADGVPYDENILAWVTPNAPEIDKMLRDSADAANTLWGLNAIVGYQKVSDKWTEADTTFAQVSAMMYTLAHTYNIKYIADPFSPTGSDLQSVKTPAQVISGQAGLCVETAVTMASAIERTNMHAVIILLPGHAQVAVETWKDSGEYLLIETTALDQARAAGNDSKKWSSTIITHLSKDEWKKYLSKDGYLAIDCDLAQQLGIQSID